MKIVGHFSKLDIINAVKNPELILDEFFNGKNIIISEKESSGYGGGFSQVFPFLVDGAKVAFKVWHNEIEDNFERYKKIDAHLKKCNLPYFVDFEYVQDGIVVKGNYLDICRMKWVEGLNLVEYISLHLYDNQVLKKLGDDFLIMINTLRENQISHGDLQHENIFISNTGEIRLIDYDSLCVPSLENRDDFCRGRRGYQHPWRGISHQNTTSLKIDYFSELVIFLTISAVAENPLIWDKYNVVLSERMLFTQEDLLEFNRSIIKEDLNRLSPNIQQLVNKLQNYLSVDLNFAPFYS